MTDCAYPFTPVFVGFVLPCIYWQHFAPLVFYPRVVPGCLAMFTNISNSLWHPMILKENYGRVFYFYINDVFYLCKCDKSLEGGNEYVGYKVKPSLANWFFMCFIALGGIVLAMNLLQPEFSSSDHALCNMYLPFSFNHK